MSCTCEHVLNMFKADNSIGFRITSGNAAAKKLGWRKLIKELRTPKKCKVTILCKSNVDYQQLKVCKKLQNIHWLPHLLVSRFSWPTFGPCRANQVRFWESVNKYDHLSPLAQFKFMLPPDCFWHGIPSVNLFILRNSSLMSLFIRHLCLTHWLLN